MRNLLIISAVMLASFVFAGAAQAQYQNCYPGGVGYGPGYVGGYGGGYGGYGGGYSGYGGAAYRGGYYGSYYQPSPYYSSGITPRVYTIGGPGLYPSRFSTGYGGVYGGYGGGYRAAPRVRGY